MFFGYPTKGGPHDLSWFSKGWEAQAPPSTGFFVAASGVTRTIEGALDFLPQEK
jgi:hypothetical protein